MTAPTTASIRLPLRSIIAGVVHVTGVSRQALTGRSQCQQFVRARQMIAHLAALHGHTTTTVGRALQRDHSTICNAIARHRALIVGERALWVLTLAAERAARELATGAAPHDTARRRLHPALLTREMRRRAITSERGTAAPRAMPLPAGGPVIVLRDGKWHLEARPCAGS